MKSDRPVQTLFSSWFGGTVVPVIDKLHIKENVRRYETLIFLKRKRNEEFGKMKKALAVAFACAFAVSSSCFAGQTATAVRTESCNELSQGSTSVSSGSSLSGKLREMAMTVELLVNRNGVRNSFRTTSFREFAAAKRRTVKYPSLGRLDADGAYTALNQGTNYVYAWDGNNRLIGKIIVKSYKWIAHRGYSSMYLENTLDAFEGAAKAGAWGIETDLRLSSDGIPYVFHDGWFQVRTTGSGWTLFSVPYSQIKKFKYKGFPKSVVARTKSNRIPTFEEVLKLCRKRKLLICVDVHPVTDKNPTATYNKICKPAVSLVKKYGMKNDVATLTRGGAPEFRKLLGITERVTGRNYTLSDDPPVK